MADGGFQAYKKYPGFNKVKTIFCPHMAAITASGWTQDIGSGMTLASNKASKYAIIPVIGLKEGDIIKGFRVLGGYNSAVITAALEKATKSAASGRTTAQICAITPTSVSGTSAALDSEATATEPGETVATDYQYNIVICGTTQEEPNAAAYVIGAEIDVVRA